MARWLLVWVMVGAMVMATSPKVIQVPSIMTVDMIVADQQGMDEWGKSPHERRRLFDIIASTGAGGVVLLSGNVHVSEAPRTDEVPYPVYGFTANGLTHVDPRYAEAVNRYRVAGPYADRNFRPTVIDREAATGPEISFQVKSIEGRTVVEHTVQLAALQICKSTKQVIS